MAKPPYVRGRKPGSVGLLIGGQSQSGDYAFGTFKDGTIIDNSIGTAIQSPLINLDKHFDNVQVYQNDVDISAEEFEIPTFSVFSL